MPVLTFDPNGRIRLTKCVAKIFSLKPGLQLTLLADVQHDRLIMVLQGVDLSDALQKTFQISPVADWRYIEIIGEDGKITVQKLLQLTLEWKTAMRLAMTAVESCICVAAKMDAFQSVWIKILALRTLFGYNETNTQEGGAACQLKFLTVCPLPAFSKRKISLS